MEDPTRQGSVDWNGFVPEVFVAKVNEALAADADWMRAVGYFPSKPLTRRQRLRNKWRRWHERQRERLASWIVGYDVTERW